MADYCVFCDTRRPEGGTNHLVLNEGKMWLEFCETCGDSEWLCNTLTGEQTTVGNLMRELKGEPKREPLVDYETWWKRNHALKPVKVEKPAPHRSTLADVWPSR